MKHLLRGLWIVALILCCNFQQVFAQQMPPIPVDKNVRIGKLDNGYNNSKCLNYNYSI